VLKTIFANTALGTTYAIKHCVSKNQIFCFLSSAVLASTGPGGAIRRQWEQTIRKEDHMLWTIAVILIILWLLGLVSSYTMGGLVHILLVIAIIVLIFGFIGGRRS